MNHHVSGALAHDRIAEALRQAHDTKRRSRGSRRPHEIPPFALPVVHEIARDRRPSDSEVW